MGTHRPPKTGKLNAALQAWNTHAQHATVPLLAQCHAGIRTLRKLAMLSRRYRVLETSELVPGKDTPDNVDPVRALRALSSQLEALEGALAGVTEGLEQLELTGESLALEFDTLVRHPLAPPEGPLENDGHDGEPDGDLVADNQLLAQLVAAQKREIAMLQRALDEAEGRGHAKKATIPATPIEIHSVQDFVQDSPIADIASNPSYYQRLLEAANSPEGQKVPMGELLTIAGLISERQLVIALDHQHDGQRRPLGSLLVDLGYTNEDAIAQALAAQLALPFVILGREFVREGALAKVPAHLARRHACFPMNFNDHALTVAMANPLDLIALEDLHIASGMHIKPCVAARGEICSHISLYYG